MKFARKIYRYVRGYGRARQNSNLFFLHIAKCGGTSVTGSIMTSYPSSEIYILSGANSYQAAKRLEVPFRTYRMHLLYYELMAKKRSLVTGHFSVNQRVLDEFSDDWHFITVLREPVDRWISYYLFNRFKKSDHFKLDCSAKEFLASERGRALGRDYLMAVTFTPKPQQHFQDPEKRLQAAKRNLRRFDLVGLTEDLPAFGKQVEEEFGIPMELSHTNENPAPERKKKEIYSSPELMHQIGSLCEPNRRLYDFAREKLVNRAGVTSSNTPPVRT